MEFWQQLAERNGPYAVFLLIVLVFLWKGILPFVKSRIEASDAALKEQAAAAREALKENTNAARDARREDQEKFLQALAERDKMQARQTEVLVELTDEIRGRR